MNNYSKYTFIIPVYNDWDSLSLLLPEICDSIGDSGDIRFVIVDDSSDSKATYDIKKKVQCNIDLIEVTHNLGHQRCISIGLSYAFEHFKSDYFIVMDSDGEDKPGDLLRIIHKSQESNSVVFANRKKRNEGFGFKFLYRVYKFIFYLLTGKKINFGNYCCIPSNYLRKIIHIPESWNHFSGSIIKSGVIYTSVSTERGRRYFGQSKMNFVKLILHGLSSISVYAEYMAIRVIIFSFLVMILTSIGIIGVSLIKIFTNLAIPGWATYTVLSFIIIILIAFFVGIFILFNVLSIKTQRAIIPAKHYGDYIYKIIE